MDSFQYDSYSSYSDASSGPRTPSPQTSLSHSPASFKLDLEPVNVKPMYIPDPILGGEDHGRHGIAPESFSQWQPTHIPYPGAAGSLLGELYEHDLPEQPVQIQAYPYHHLAPQHQRVQHLQQQEAGPMRRATYPFVRQERGDLDHYTIPPFLPADDRRYSEHHPAFSHVPQQQQQQLISLYEHSSPAAGYRDLEPRIKLEDMGSPAIVPAQMLYRSPSLDMQHHQLPIMPPPSHPVQLTDDAASKETQYLRRRCTNCSQTEPPSWRRSTLNPGKIVCNKCGLYERTHLRPRPLRFDELRTGNKTRKGKKGGVVKSEHEAAPIVRRTSVSSAPSSDWDDSLSSGSSAPSSSFNSPSPARFTLPPERSSRSPTLLPNDGGIRLPDVNIASLSVQNSPQPTVTEFALQASEYFVQQPVDIPGATPEQGGWQPASAGVSSPDQSGSSLPKSTVA